MPSLSIWLRYSVVALTASFVGCIGGSPAAVEAPDVDPGEIVSAALETYDQDGDKALAGEELEQVPGIAAFLPEYDKDGDKRVSQEELASRFERLFTIVNFCKLNCAIILNGRPLEGAEVVFTPEPFMGDQFKAGSGTTSYEGGTKIAIPDDQLPEPTRRLGGGLYAGLYKVSITHPTAKIPQAYQGDNTVLGHEVSALTTAGTSAVFRLDSKGTRP